MKKLAVMIGAGAVIAGAAAVLHMGSLLISPVRGTLGPPPTRPPYESIEFPSSDGRIIRGWFAAGEGDGGVALFHGIRSDRRSMLGRAAFLHQAGYSVLVIDLQAHGQSDGDAITFGVRESDDARAAVDYLRALLDDQPVAAIGSSLGGAACVLGDTTIGVDALVLEAVYPDVTTAVRNRLRIRFGVAGPWLSPLLTAQLRPRLGVSPSEMRPIDSIGRIEAPILVIAGTEDRRTTIDDSRRVFHAIRGPKELWEVEGAAHVDFHRHSPAEYESRVMAFLRAHLGPAG